MTHPYPALKLLAGAYLHQDYDLEYADADAAVADFMTSEVEMARLLPAEVDRALLERADEAGAERFWLETLDACYVPGADGIQARAWLRSIGAVARAAGY